MKNVKEEKIYVYIALIVGLLFIFLVPPFLSPDEDTHFIKSYLISKGKLYPTSRKGVVGNTVPRQMINYILNQNKYSSDMDKKYSYHSLFNDQFDSLDYHKNVFTSYSTAKVVPIAYAAPAGGILFSKIMAKIFDMENISSAYMIQFARLFSLLLSIFIIYYAIKITPIYKKTMFTVGLMPMTLYLCSMVTYDSILIPLSMLAISIMLKLIFDDKIKKIDVKYLVALVIIGVFLFNIKTIYSFIYILMFFIPKEKFSNMKGKIKMFAIIIGLILISSLLIKLPFYFLAEGAGDGLTAKQLNFILHNPFKYLGYVFNNIIDQRLFLINSTIGVLGLLDTYLPISIVAIFIVYLFFIAIAEGSTEKYQINWKMKLSLIIPGFLCIIAIFTSMYIYWTPKISSIGEKSIYGVQGRYFIPLLLPFLFAFSNKKLSKIRLFDAIKKNYILIPISVLLVAVFMVVVRFWS